MLLVLSINHLIFIRYARHKERRILHSLFTGVYIIAFFVLASNAWMF